MAICIQAATRRQSMKALTLTLFNLFVICSMARAGNGLITGPVNANLSGTFTYEVYDDGSYPTWDFKVSNGTIVSRSKSGYRYQARVTFSRPGAQWVKFTSQGVTKDTYDVNVDGCPNPPIVANGAHCGPGNVTLSAQAGWGDDIRWYDGGGNVLASGSSYAPYVSSGSQTYYVDAYYAPNNCASTKVARTATINSPPAEQPFLSATPGMVCGSGTVTLLSLARDNESDMWYDAAGHVINSTPNATVLNNTFYGAKRNNTTGCIGPKSSVTVTVDPKPVVYTLSGGGSYCTTDALPAITLGGSESQVAYQLANQTGAIGLIAQEGTGAPLAYTAWGAGRYVVTAYSKHQACQVSMGGAVDVLAYPPSAGGTITPALVYSYGVATGTLTVSDYTGDIVQWEQSNGTTWEPLAGTAGVAAYAYSNLTMHTDFRVLIKSGVCTAVYSAVATINVYQQPTLQATNTVIAYGGSTTLSTGKYDRYRWWLNGQEIAGANQQTYEARRPGRYAVTVQGSDAASSATTGELEIKTALGARQNLESTTVVRVPGLKTANADLYALQPNQLAQTITYSDGMGRPEQMIAVGQSPLGHDMIQYAEYSAYGLSEKKYLPYASTDRDGQKRTSPALEQGGFYRGQVAGVAHSAAPYVVSKLADSPLANLREQGAPGAAWQPVDDIYDRNDNTTKKAYELNADTDKVYSFNYDFATGTVSVGVNKFFGSRTLFANKTYDEKNNVVIEFVDKQGRTICKRVQADTSQFADTYYIYDDFGNLAVVLPPEGVEKLKTIIGN